MAKLSRGGRMVADGDYVITSDLISPPEKPPVPVPQPIPAVALT